jgi:hypothetical protein
MTSVLDDDLELELRALFAAQAASVDGALGGELDAVHVVELAAARPRRARRRSALVGAVAIAATLSAVVAVHGGVRAAGPSAGSASPVHWSTDYVDLSAADFSIDVGGQTYTTAGAHVDLNSDPGDRSYQTLELDWTEHGHDMRWNIYFRSDGHEWWAFEMRTYNGRDGAGADRVTFPGEHFRTPLGQAYTGDLDLTASEGGVTSHLVAKGLRLQAFVKTTDLAPSASGTSVAPNEAAATPAGAATTTAP